MKGRPEIDLDPKQLEQLCAIDCTDAEIAAFFDVSVRTIERRRKKAAFAEAMKRGRDKGKVALRRAQYKRAIDGNPVMLIWLGKQRLGQKDKVTNEHTFGGPVDFTARLISQLNRRAEQTGTGEVTS